MILILRQFTSLRFW